MALPGKLFLAFIEEDDPQKSFFRLKPLLVEEGGNYVPFTEADAFPEDGCIRIVPDRNEAIHFKTRMREMGAFAIVDLREHPYVNNKIRANKNYRPGDTEHNAYIIYSDVVCEPQPNTVFGLIKMHPEEAENALVQDIPVSRYLLLKPEDDVLPQVWTYENDPHQDCIRLQKGTEVLADGENQFFTLPVSETKTVSFAVRRPGGVPKAQAQPVQHEEPVTAAEPKPEAPALEPETAPQPKAEPKPAAEPKPEAPAKPEQPPKPAQKPWIQHSNLFTPRRVDPSLSPRQQYLQQQCGLNPKQNRGRSIMEIVDEKWGLSRMDQLTDATPRGITTHSPADNEVRKALDTIRVMWETPSLREAMVQTIADVDGLEDAIDARRQALRTSAVNAQLNELEAQRLEMLAAIEKLKQCGHDVRAELKQEIRRDEAASLKTLTEQTERARAERDQLVSENEALRAQAESAKHAIEALTDGRFEERLNDYLINRHACDLLEVMQKRVLPEAVPQDGAETDADTLITAVRECFASAGQPIDRTGAINLLICTAQSPAILISGTPGTGKTGTVRLLARALGIDEERFMEFAPDDSVLTDSVPFDEADAPAIVLLDDMNLSESKDMTRGLNGSAEKGRFTLFGTVQDDGTPLPAYLLDRAFTVRLVTEGSASVWMPPQASGTKQYPTVSARAMRATFAPTMTQMPAAVVKRMEKLRADLGLAGVRISRRALTAVWNYCAAAIPLMPIEPTSVLDLAVAQRVLPAILAGAPLKALAGLSAVMEDMPRCKALLRQPLPIEV